MNVKDLIELLRAFQPDCRFGPRLASFVTSPKFGPKKVVKRWSRRLGPVRPSSSLPVPD